MTNEGSDVSRGTSDPVASGTHLTGAERRGLDAVGRWARLPHLPAEGLARYRRWLAEEAAPAGGIGPKEVPRLWTRHLVDALTFAGPRDVDEPRRIVDVGTGVGLPGIPLAMAFPRSEVVLVDRARRRADLVRRAVRILALDNVVVVEGDAGALATAGIRPHLMTFRGSLGVPAAARLAVQAVGDGGAGVLGLSRRPESPSLPVVDGLDADLEVVRVPEDVLDSPAWLLRIRPRRDVPRRS